MDNEKKSIGIWGFGIVGKAAARYFCKQGATLSVLDKRDLSDTELALLQSFHAAYIQETDAKSVIQWLDNQSHILASPGVDLRPYGTYQNRFITELDLFCQLFKKPIIAVTGSVGKTTVTTLLSSLLRAKYPQLWTGGNIGTGMLDAVDTPADAALLELSSFQLEHCNYFAPHVAIVTNFYPNHIDRHGTIDAYFQAKKKIMTHQMADQLAVVPLALRDQLGTLPARTYFVASNDDIIPDTVNEGLNIIYAHNGNIMLRNTSGEKILGSLSDLPDITFTQNWLTIAAALHALDISLETVQNNLQETALPAHRLELVNTINGVNFYDDSKGTTPAATLAAVYKLHANNRPVILILGGLSKGIDRAPLVAQLKDKVSFIYCIGKERVQLGTWCQANGIAHIAIETLDDTFNHFQRTMKPGDQLLLSPAGSSFDQFKDYKDRGDYFKQLVNSISLT